MSAPKVCEVCGESKAIRDCGVCNKALCKSCLVNLDKDSFSFLAKVPARLSHENYCPGCFEEHVAPEQVRYDELMEQAKEVYFLTKAYRGNVRVLKRHTKRVVVESCPDRRETILRMAFRAAELGLNAIIEAEVDCKKIRIHRYQTSVWSGSALPANVDGAQLDRSSLRGF